LEEAPEQSEIQEFVSRQVSEAKVHLLPIRSVGVGGDERSHLQVAAIEHGDLSPEQLAKLGSDLPAHFRHTVNRVIYALGPEPLAQHALVKTLLTADVRNQLRQADRIVFEEMRAANLLTAIKQFPVILLPLAFGAKKTQRSIVLRPVITSTFMTVQAMLPVRDLPGEFLDKTAERILAEVPGVSQVFLDLTNKPPATTEWE